MRKAKNSSALRCASCSYTRGPRALRNDSVGLLEVGRRLMHGRPLEDRTMTGGSTMDLVGMQVWVHDQDEALEFYTTKLGFEVRADATLPGMGFRWLTVGVPGERLEVVLMAVPRPPTLDEATAAQIHTLVAKGFAQTLFLVTEDCQRSYEELRERGV